MTLLEVRRLTKSFGGLNAVRNLDFEVNAGEVLSIIGPNGAGKTTVFNLVTGFYRPDSGSIKFNGESILGLKPHQICRKGICRTFQIVRPFPGMTVLDNVMVAAFSVPHHGDARLMALEVLEFTGLAGRRHQMARELTLAGRKRLEVARALATRPKLILLDEVFAGLNPKEVDEMIDLVVRMRERGISATTGVEHVMKVVMSISDRVIVLQYGEKIAEGPPKEIALNGEVIRAYLGADHA